MTSARQAPPPAATTVLTGRTVEGPISARIKIDGREYLNFFGAGYLALAGLPEIRGAVTGAVEQGVPFGRQLAAAAGGVDTIFDAVERAGAAACGTEASVYFASGYFIGAVGLKAMETPFDLIAIDETAHYNLKDAAKGSGRRMIEFAHCDVQSLRDALKRELRAQQRPLVMTDGAFATTGGIPPLRDYAAELAAYDGRLFIDEAHSFGVVGTNGRGAAEYCDVEYMASSGATLSKAYCAQGALVGCSAETALRLRFQTPLRGACAGSPLSAAAATASLAYIARRPNVLHDLRMMTAYFRQRLRGIGLVTIDSPAPIVSFQCGTGTDMLALQRRLFDKGIHIHYSTYLGAGREGMIRCAMFRDHSREDIDALIDHLR